MVDDKNLPPIPPYPREGDKGALIEAGTLAVELAGEVPGIGFLKDRALEYLVRAPLEKKRAHFHERIAIGLARCEKILDNFDPSKLGESEEFVSTVFVATQAAMRSSSESKREALKNAVLNTACGMTLDEVMRGSFMSYVETFSSVHIQVLRIFEDPLSTLNALSPTKGEYRGAIKEYIRSRLVPNVVTEDALNRVFKDLDNSDMIADYQITPARPLNSSSKLKPSGREFLKFISDPTDRR